MSTSSGRAGWRAALVAAAVACILGLTCGYPDFEFGPRKLSSANGAGGGGSGGRDPIVGGNGGVGPSTGPSTVASGGSGGAGITSVTASSSKAASTVSAGGAPGAQVPCGGSRCAPGLVCCYHTTDADLDHCDDPGACGFDYYEFACNDPDDCPGGECCALFDFSSNFDGIDCRSSCGSSDIPMCTIDAECFITNCTPFPNTGDAYPGYEWCN